RETGAGLIIIGFLIALYDIAEIFIKPLGALLSRKVGEWAVLRTGLVLFSIASGLYLLLPPQWLILVRLLQGAGAALFSVMSMTLLIRYFAERKGTALGIYGAFKNSGYVLAPTVGGLFVHYHGFVSIFVLCLAIGLLIFVLTYVIRPGGAASASVDAGRKRKQSPALKDLIASLKDRRTLPIFAIMFFNMIFMGAFFGFMPVLLSRKGLDPIEAGAVLAANAAFYLAVQPFAGRLSDGLGRKRVIAFGLALSTLSIGLIPFLGSPFYIAGACLLALGIGCVAPLGEALVGDVSEEESLALNLGIAGSYKELGEMAGPLSIGFVGQGMGLACGFLFVAVVGVGSLVCLGFLRERKGFGVDGTGVLG
ncbi:MAG: MFS transporter, partial [Deltaproteobacteria bacterium]|nr:MFS transporter [Deltaproteobacteria bacterium]